MPSFPVPVISADAYSNGGAVSAGDSVVPVIVVTDGTGKAKMVKGAPVLIADLRAPNVSGFSVTQLENSYEIRPSGGTVSDESSGTVIIRLVCSTAASLPASSLIAAIATGVAGTDFGEHSVTGYVGGEPVALATDAAALATSRVHDVAAFRNIEEGDTVYPYILVIDASANSIAAAGEALAPVTDYTAPSLSSFQVESANETTFTLSWTLSDSGDSATASPTPLYLSVYSSASAPTSSQVVTGTGTDFVRQVVVADGKATITEVIGQAPPAGDVALTAGTTYHVYAVASDVSGNTQQTPSYVSATTTDDTVPTNLGSVTVSLGSNPASEILFSNLNAITDNVALSSIHVLYGTVNDPNDASTVTEIASVGQDTYLVTGLVPSTQYYCWTTATDTSANTAGPTAVTGGGIATDAGNQDGDVWLFYGTGSVHEYQCINEFTYTAGGYSLSASHVTLYDSNQIRGVLPLAGDGSASDTAASAHGASSATVMTNGTLETGFSQLVWTSGSAAAPRLQFSIRIPTDNPTQIPATGWRWRQRCAAAVQLGSWLIVRNGQTLTHNGTGQPSGSGAGDRTITG